MRWNMTARSRKEFSITVDNQQAFFRHDLCVSTGLLSIRAEIQ